MWRADLQEMEQFTIRRAYFQSLTDGTKHAGRAVGLAEVFGFGACVASSRLDASLRFCRRSEAFLFWFVLGRTPGLRPPLAGQRS